jgi:hypothetical protein
MGKEKAPRSHYETEALSRITPAGETLAFRPQGSGRTWEIYRRSRIMTSRIVSITSSAIGIEPCILRRFRSGDCGIVTLEFVGEE